MIFQKLIVIQCIVVNDYSDTITSILQYEQYFTLTAKSPDKSSQKSTADPLFRIQI